jgi:hypothetical protein
LTLSTRSEREKTAASSAFETGPSETAGPLVSGADGEAPASRSSGGKRTTGVAVGSGVGTGSVSEPQAIAKVRARATAPASQTVLLARFRCHNPKPDTR